MLGFQLAAAHPRFEFAGDFSCANCAHPSDPSRRSMYIAHTTIGTIAAPVSNSRLRHRRTQIHASEGYKGDINAGTFSP